MEDMEPTPMDSMEQQENMRELLMSIFFMGLTQHQGEAQDLKNNGDPCAPYNEKKCLIHVYRPFNQ